MNTPRVFVALQVRRNTFVNNNDFHVDLVNTSSSSVFDNYFATVGPRGQTARADWLTAAGGTSFYYTAAAAVAGAAGAAGAASSGVPGRGPVLLPPAGPRNVVGGDWLAGNWWPDYGGADHSGRGIGDTDVPYAGRNGSLSSSAADAFPLKIPNSVSPICNQQ
jgi:hypothetical protein